MRHGSSFGVLPRHEVLMVKSQGEHEDLRKGIWKMGLINGEGTLVNINDLARVESTLSRVFKMNRAVRDIPWESWNSMHCLVSGFSGTKFSRFPGTCVNVIPTTTFGLRVPKCGGRQGGNLQDLCRKRCLSDGIRRLCLLGQHVQSCL